MLLKKYPLFTNGPPRCLRQLLLKDDEQNQSKELIGEFVIRFLKFH